MQKTGCASQGFSVTQKAKDGKAEALATVWGRRGVGDKPAFGGKEAKGRADGQRHRSDGNLREDRRGLGVGRKLYTALLELLRLQGYGSAVAVLTDPNAPSEAFHEKLGFSVCGRLPRAGYKAGRWWGVSWWQKELQAPGFVPGPILPLPALSRGTVERVLRENS